MAYYTWWFGVFIQSYCNKHLFIILIREYVHHILTSAMLFTTTIIYKKFLVPHTERHSIYDKLSISIMYASGATSLLLAFGLGIFIYILVSRRMQKWDEILKMNRLFFHPTMRNAFSVQQPSLVSFISYWTNKSEQQVLHELGPFSKQVYDALKNDVDTSNDDKISYEEYFAFAKRQGVLDDADIRKTWNFISNNDYVCEEELENIFRVVTFERRRFAFKIQTDAHVTWWCVKYLAIILYGGSIVLILRTWGVDTGSSDLSMVKLYIAVCTYLIGMLHDRIAFIHAMLIRRPFNLGDVIQVNDTIYTVTSISPSFTGLHGAISTMVVNSALFVGPIANLSRSKITDSCVLYMPMDTPYDIVDTVLVRLNEYAADNPYIITRDDMRCGWTGGDCEKGKELQFWWRYNCLIQDRVTYINMKTAIVNYVLKGIQVNVNHASE